MLSIHCQCGGRLEVAEKALGLPARCAACGAVVRPVAPWGPLEEGDNEFFARLVITTGPARVGEQIVLGGPGPIDVGKQSGLGIVLAGEMVSHTHARLVRRGLNWIVHDQQSTNGTGVNGKRITEAQLKAGDRVRIGEYELLFTTRVGGVEELAIDEPSGVPKPREPGRPGPGPRVAGAGTARLAGPRGVRIGRWVLLGVFVLAAIIAAMLLRPSESFMFTPRSQVRHPPVQTLISDGKPWPYRGWTITPLADFSADAVVLGKKSYDDTLTPLARWNLAVGWGAMSDPEIMADLRIGQDVRGLQVAFNKTPPVDWELLKTQMAVIYAIPATDDVLAAIERVKPGDVVAIRGKLVRVESSGQRTLVSNLKRGRAFTGDSDVMWVEAIGPRGAASQP